MNIKFSITTLAFASLGLTSVQAQELLVGWGSFNDPTSSVDTNNETVLATDFNASFTISGTTSSPVWKRTAQGSNDQTIGSFAIDPPLGTSSAAGVLTPNVVNADGISFTFSLVNNTAVDYTLNSVVFDVYRAFGAGPDSASITYSDSVGGSATNVLFDNKNSSPVFSNGNDFDDMTVSLAALTDNVLEVGSKATFTLTVEDQNISNNTFTGFDNIGIVGTAVPEPSSYALMAGLVGLLSIGLRRRR